MGKLGDILDRELYTRFCLQVVPARTGRYRARCTRHGGERVFIPDLQIAAELNAASTFEYGGVDWFQKNDQILVMLGWVEIVQAQIERRVPKVDACGTLTARGYPFLTDNMKQILTEDSHREKFDLIHEPFEKLERSSTPADCCKITSRTRSKSFDGIPGAKCIGFHDELNGNYSRSSVSFLGIPDPRLQAVTSASFDPFYNAFLQPPTPGANRSGCHCFRL